MEGKLEKMIQRLKAGDLNAFDELYLITKDKVYKTVYVLATNKEEVDEIVNEIYFQIWKSIRNYNETSPFSYWMNGLIFRQVKQWKLKAWKRVNLFKKFTTFITPQEFIEKEDVLINVKRDSLLESINKLSYKSKEIILLYYFHEYSQSEIADILNIPLGTVKSRHHSALKQLRVSVKDFNEIEQEGYKSVK